MNSDFIEWLISTCVTVTFGRWSDCGRSRGGGR